MFHVSAGMWSAVLLFSPLVHEGAGEVCAMNDDRGSCMLSTGVQLRRSHPRRRRHQSAVQRADAVAVVLRGESFRIGGQFSRATADSAESQMEATQSQLVFLVEPLRHLGFDVDVFSATYTTQFTETLIEKLGEFVRIDLRSRRPGSQGENAHEALQAVDGYSLQQNKTYRFLVMLRHDMVLKQDISKVVQTDELFLSPFNVTKALRGYFPQLQYVIPDTLQAFPGKFLLQFVDMISQEGWPNEGMWDHMMKRIGGIERFGLLLPDWYADSDAEKSFNPLYRMAGRAEGRLAPEVTLGGHTGASQLHQDPLPWGSSLPLVIAAAFVFFAIGSQLAPHIPAHMTSYAVCFIYIAVSVSIDISIVAQKSPGSKQISAYDFNPACALLITEAVKLVISCLLYAFARACDCGPASSMQRGVTWTDVLYLLAPAALFTLNNMMVFVAIGRNDTSTFGVFRETLIIWTAILWRMVFRAPLGRFRLLSLLTVVIGLILNQIPNLLKEHVSVAFVWVMIMTWCNTAGSVLNEYAMKISKDLNINFQNMILYSACMFCNVLFLLASDGTRLSREPRLIFDGFTNCTFLTIGLQAIAGLLVARILKYADSVMKAISACLRGPVFVVVAPLFTDAQNLSALIVVSSLIVASGCIAYMTQGPLQVESEKARA